MADPRLDDALTAELKGLIVKAQGGDLAAAYQLCEAKKPPSLYELLFIVHPLGRMTAKQFDTLADSYATWQDEKP